jgi:hypothetical protein
LGPPGFPCSLRNPLCLNVVSLCCSDGSVKAISRVRCNRPTAAHHHNSCTTLALKAPLIPSDRTVSGAFVPLAFLITASLLLFVRGDQWIELATWENTVLELEPISRSVPTTISRITATITAYSAMSWPSSDQRAKNLWFIGAAFRFNTSVISVSVSQCQWP